MTVRHYPVWFCNTRCCFDNSTLLVSTAAEEGFVCAPAGCVVIGMSLPTMFQARHYRGLRAAIFTMLGAWGVVPVTQLLLTNGHVWAIKRAFMLDLLMGAIYVVSYGVGVECKPAGKSYVF
jgi:predicted membrane channel-forming protein YqfA (hemolysin III family)